MLQSEILLSFRYDVELFQRIESLIGKKLPAFPTQEEEVMMLVERVSEAQRFARLVSHFLNFKLNISHINLLLEKMYISITVIYNMVK